jgi:hypothetical protein
MHSRHAVIWRRCEVLHRGHVVGKLNMHVKKDIIPAFLVFSQCLGPSRPHDEQAAFRGNSIEHKY